MFLKSETEMSHSSRLFRVVLTLQRVLLSVWVGAAALYVITSIAEQTSPHFNTVVKDQLATVRFPLYYKFGFIIHIVCATMGFLAWRSAETEHRRHMLCVLVLIMLSGLAMSLDFRFVYQPLQELIIPPGQARSAQFETLHVWSKYANEVHVTIVGLAAFLASVPLRTTPEKLNPAARNAAKFCE